MLATILAYDDARSTPVANAVHSGYQRIDVGQSIVLMDTGAPPRLTLSAEAHAGCLSFELSARGQRIVVNCGLPETGRGNWRHLARATAAHSTATLNETSSCQFLDTSLIRRLFGTLISRGPRHVTVTREQTDEAVHVRAVHDGYAHRFGIIHQRTVVLAADRGRLDGEDVFLPARGEALASDAKDAFAIRFHLHPSVRANRLSDSRGVMLTLPNKDVWTFLRRLTGSRSRRASTLRGETVHGGLRRSSSTGAPRKRRASSGGSPIRRSLRPTSATAASRSRSCRSGADRRQAGALRRAGLNARGAPAPADL